MRGRKPKPTAQREVQSTPTAGGGRRTARHKQVAKREPKLAGALRMPGWLTPIAQAEWRRVAPELAEKKIAARVDAQTLAAYCTAVSDATVASKAIEAEGHVVTIYAIDENTGEAVPVKKQKNPWCTVLAEAMRQIRAFASEFGLTPVSRNRLTVPEPAKDPFEEFLGRGKRRGAGNEKTATVN